MAKLAKKLAELLTEAEVIAKDRQNDKIDWQNKTEGLLNTVIGKTRGRCRQLIGKSRTANREATTKQCRRLRRSQKRKEVTHKNSTRDEVKKGHKKRQQAKTAKTSMRSFRHTWTSFWQKETGQEWG